MVEITSIPKILNVVDVPNVRKENKIKLKKKSIIVINIENIDI